MFRKTLLTLVFGVPIAFAMQAAQAAPIQITGTSTGTFSAPTGCTGSEICSTATSGGVANAELYWGGTANGNSGNYRTGSTSTSTLIGGSTTISTQTPSLGYVIGSLTYFNGTADSGSDPNTLSSTYSLTISFTAPGASSDTQTFALTITNTADSGQNGTPDKISGFTLTDLSGLSFTLPGVTVNDFRYVCYSGCSGQNPASFDQSTNTLTNPEQQTAVLAIEADFTATPTSTPEPASLTLLGAGLVGAGLLRKRRK